MKLNVLERLLLVSVLPKDGISIHTMRVVNELGNTIGFSEADLKKYEIKDIVEQEPVLNNNGKPVIDKKTGKPKMRDTKKSTGKVQWNAKGFEEVEIEIGERGAEVIVDTLQRLSKEKKLGMQFLSLIEKFNIEDPEHGSDESK